MNYNFFLNILKAKDLNTDDGLTFLARVKIFLFGHLSLIEQWTQGLMLTESLADEVENCLLLFFSGEKAVCTL